MEQAQTQVAELTSRDPRFAALKADVLKAVEEHPEFDNVYQAYAHVLSTQALPGEQTKVLDHLKTQAQGATVTPGTPTTASIPKFKNFEEAARYFETHPAEAALMSKR